MDNLRWILIVLGLLILIGIVLFANPNRTPKPAKPRYSGKRSSRQRVEPVLDADSDPDPSAADNEMQQQSIIGLEKTPEKNTNEKRQLPDHEEETVTANGDEAIVTQSEYADAAKVKAEPLVASTSVDNADEPITDVPGTDEIVTIYVVANQRHPISGVELLDAALKAGLHFGAQDIFHRLPQGSEKPMFSMANLTAPGYFDRTAWNLFETQGVTLFMTLPGPTSALVAWDSMLATAERLAELLKAEVQDKQRDVLTRQTIAHQREAMRAYDRQQH